MSTRPTPAHAAFESDDPSSFLLPLVESTLIDSNPARLTGLRCLRWQLGHRRLFGLRELATHHLAAALSGQRWGLGAGLSLRGPVAFRETAAWLGVAASPVAALSVGVALHHLRLTRRTLAPTSGRTLSVGLRLHLTAGAELSVWYRGAARTLAEPRAQMLLVRRIGDEATAYAAVTRRGYLGRSTGGPHPARLDLAAGGRLHQRLWLYLGTRSAPRQFTAAVRTETGRHFLEYRAHSHAVLGASHAVLVGHSCKRR